MFSNILLILIFTSSITAEGRNGLKCNQCVYMELDSRTPIDGEQVGSFQHHRSCNIGKEPASSYQTSCEPLLMVNGNGTKTVDPVCLTFLYELKQENLKVVIRGCYHQSHNVTAQEKKCNSKTLMDFYEDTFTPEIRSYFEKETRVAGVPRKMKLKRSRFDATVCLCDKDNCNGMNDGTAVQKHNSGSVMSNLNVFVLLISVTLIHLIS